MKHRNRGKFLAATIVFFAGTLFYSDNAFARATPVEVQNWPAEQAIHDTDHPGNQPFQFDDYTSVDIESGRDTSLSIGVSSELVPEGKRLIIQHISFNISSKGFMADPVCDVDVIDRSTGHSRWVVTHTLEPTKYNRAYDRISYISSKPITLYADPQSKVQVGCSTLVSEDTLIRVGLTGYYIDL